ncbi:hypothetical protein N657DRAFT_646025 [Parathielavia appendiculata]|uniref:Uncharacterized protein n=1 Tax=Parathielavia appendiculata TaxID=2587402 RepID=A0AAN6Z2K5_9PEZI|nr:hypothetical protein N657DRAFT_646025 [Parathielavia appendiculata]
MFTYPLALICQFQGRGGGGAGKGGTEFPELRRRADGRWCVFVECLDGDGGSGGSDEDVKGVVFKLVPRNMVCWENFRADGTGRGYEETWHAGLPLRREVKVGLDNNLSSYDAVASIAKQLPVHGAFAIPTRVWGLRTISTLFRASQAERLNWHF